MLHVFQDVVSGRRPVQDLSGLLAGETLIDRQAHPAATASGVHLHERQGLGSTAGPHESADRRGQVAKGDLVGHRVEHRAGRGAFKGQGVELHQVVDVDVALPNAARSKVRRGAMRLSQSDQIGQVVAPAIAVDGPGRIAIPQIPAALSTAVSVRRAAPLSRRKRR